MILDELLFNKLRDGCVDMGMVLDNAQLHSLCAYVRLLEKWNQAYNLTAVRDPIEMVTYHLLDSLAILPWLRGLRSIDVGTGAGLPGIPLSLALPQRQFCLLDSNGKKTRFLVQAKAELGLKNVTVFQQRAQHVVDKAGFDMVLSRAFASLGDMLAHTEQLLAADGRWLAMKGVYPAEELAMLPSAIELEAVEPVNVSGLEAERHLVILRRREQRV